LVIVRNPTETQVRQQAFEFYLGRGCLPGHDLDDWFQAEHDLTLLVVSESDEVNSTQTKKSGRKQEVFPNATASFAWFWGS
jgi:Protein of unknown function (DUF2934)